MDTQDKEMTAEEMRVDDATHRMAEALEKLATLGLSVFVKDFGLVTGLSMQATALTMLVASIAAKTGGGKDGKAGKEEGFIDMVAQEAKTLLPMLKAVRDEIIGQENPAGETPHQPIIVSQHGHA